MTSLNESRLTTTVVLQVWFPRAAAGSHRNLLQRQIHRPQSKSNLCFHKSSRWFWRTPKSENPGLQDKIRAQETKLYQVTAGDGKAQDCTLKNYLGNSANKIPEKEWQTLNEGNIKDGTNGRDSRQKQWDLVTLWKWYQGGRESTITQQPRNWVVRIATRWYQ